MIKFHYKNFFFFFLYIDQIPQNAITFFMSLHFLFNQLINDDSAFNIHSHKLFSINFHRLEI